MVDLWSHAASGRREPTALPARFLKGCTFASLILFTSAYLIFAYFPKIAPKRTQKNLVAEKERLQGPEKLPIYYLKKKNFSIEFYTSGDAIRLQNLDSLEELLNNSTRDFVSLDQSYFSHLRPEIKNAFENHGLFGKHLLLSDNPQSGHRTLNAQ